jgi:hypothetical protein
VIISVIDIYRKSIHFRVPLSPSCNGLSVLESIRRKDNGEKNIAAFAVTLVAAVVVMMLSAPDKWLSAVFVTVVTFSGMISYYWRLWKSDSGLSQQPCWYLTCS